MCSYKTRFRKTTLCLELFVVTGRHINICTCRVHSKERDWYLLLQSIMHHIFVYHLSQSYYKTCTILLGFGVFCGFDLVCLFLCGVFWFFWLFWVFFGGGGLLFFFVGEFFSGFFRDKNCAFYCFLSEVMSWILKCF